MPLATLLVAGGCASAGEQKLAQLLERQRNSAVCKVANLTKSRILVEVRNQHPYEIEPDSMTPLIRVPGGDVIRLRTSQGGQALSEEIKLEQKQTVTVFVLPKAGKLEVRRFPGEVFGTEAGQVVRTINLSASVADPSVVQGQTSTQVGTSPPDEEAKGRVPVTIGGPVSVTAGSSTSNKLSVREQDSFLAVIYQGQDRPRVALLRSRVKSVPVAAGGG
jgi:hypothetical protein